MAGIVKTILYDDEAGDPNRPEIIERKRQLAEMEAKSRNLDSDGNWGSDKKSMW